MNEKNSPLLSPCTSVFQSGQRLLCATLHRFWAYLCKLSLLSGLLALLASQDFALQILKKDHFYISYSLLRKTRQALSPESVLPACVWSPTGARTRTHGGRDTVRGAIVTVFRPFALETVLLLTNVTPQDSI